MSYLLEYSKSYADGVVTATPILGDNLPTLTHALPEDQLGSLTFEHRVRTMDITKPGLTALIFGVPGNYRVVEHDGIIREFTTYEEALSFEREGELHLLLDALANQ